MSSAGDTGSEQQGPTAPADQQKDVRPPPLGANVAPPSQPPSLLRRLLDAARTGIEFCGKHPFATGLFALLGLFGLGLSIYSAIGDREAAKTGAEHAKRVEEKLEAIDSKVGQAYKGGVFLYEEPVEIYWNNWWAHPLRTPAEVKKYGQAEQTITGEGKTVDFVGVLSMNCSNGKYFWRGTENFQQKLSDAETIELVPRQVIKNSYKLFCDF